MKLVGATNWFVRGPFMLEGLLCGLGGAFAAVVLLMLGKEAVLPAIIPGDYTSPDVQALVVPGDRRCSCSASALRSVRLGSGMTLRRFLKV